jgi:hypothetical protein
VPDLKLDWDRIRERLGMVVEKPGEKIPQVIQPKPLEPDLPLAASPTPHPAGSPGKIEVMRARAAAGRSLFHPHDNADVLA